MPLRLSGFVTSDGNPLEGGTIEVGNVPLDMSAAILNDTLSNAYVYLYEAWYDDSMTFIEADLIYAGKVSGRPGITEQYATIQASPHLNPWSQRCPRTKITKKNFPFLPTRGLMFSWANGTTTQIGATSYIE
jgi:hypothetical protein